MICSLISDLNGKQELEYLGIRLLNHVYSKAIQCGNPDEREFYDYLLQSLLELFVKKLARLVLYAESTGLENEFMIKKNVLCY